MGTPERAWGGDSAECRTDAGDAGEDDETG